MENKEIVIGRRLLPRYIKEVMTLGENRVANTVVILANAAR